MTAAPSALLEAALELASAGFAVFPCKPRGKDPLTLHGFKDATRDEAQISRWWTPWRNANIGLPTGEVNGIMIVDVDPPEGQRLLAKLEERHGKLPPTVAKQDRQWQASRFSRWPKIAARFQAARGMDSISAATAAMSSRRREFTRTARLTSGTSSRRKSSCSRLNGSWTSRETAKPS